MEINLTQAGQLLAKSETIVLSTHLMPDGDGLGAEIALYFYLKRFGKKVKIINPDPVPKRYAFLDPSKVIEIYSEEKTKISELDLLVILDTNDPKRLGKAWGSLSKKAKEILFLDHHPGHSEQELTNNNCKIVVDIHSSSIGELLYRLFHQAKYQNVQLDPKAPAFYLSPEIALGLYVSIITDTNSFRYARTTALSHRIAAELIDFGLQPEEIYQNVYSTKTKDHLRLIGEVLSRVEEIPFGKTSRTIGWVEIPASLRKKFFASSDDTQSIVNFLLLLEKTEFLILFREEDDHRVKVSLKSKGNISILKVAQEFDGGGHEFAAGFTATGSISEIRDKLLNRLQKLAHS